MRVGKLAVIASFFSIQQECSWLIYIAGDGLGYRLGTRMPILYRNREQGVRVCAV